MKKNMKRVQGAGCRIQKKKAKRKKFKGFWAIPLDANGLSGMECCRCSGNATYGSEHGGFYCAVCVNKTANECPECGAAL